MKKTILLIALTATFFNCQAQKKPIMTSQVTTVQTSDMLVGQHDKEDLLKVPYSLWFQPNYDNYKPLAATLSELKKRTKDITVTVVLGTWCEDSQYKIPEFYKVMDAIGFDTENVSLIMVDKSKTTPEKFEEGLNITNVPTFIFYKNEKEIHRIVERPMETLEKDMLKILSGQPYKHAYEN